MNKWGIVFTKVKYYVEHIEKNKYKLYHDEGNIYFQHGTLSRLVKKYQLTVYLPSKDKGSIIKGGKQRIEGFINEVNQLVLIATLTNKNTI